MHAGVFGFHPAQAGLEKLKHGLFSHKFAISAICDIATVPLIAVKSGNLDRGSA
jgi:hypothetical protein